MAKETKTVSLRLPVEQVEWLTKSEESINQAVINTIERLQMIEKYADRDISGKFTPEEWNYLADSLNGSIVEGDFRFRSFALAANVEDSAEYDGLDKKWGVNVATLTDKIKSLSSSSVEAVFRRVEAFWNDGNKDLAEWSKF